MGKVGNQTTAVKRYGEGCNRMAGVTGFEPWSSCSKGRAKGSSERIVRWERFLPQRYLRVLLVECDDSTRQVVSALLRNCGYQVTAVGDAVQAWQLLEDPSNCYDLVLTEVVMPSLSGIGLLYKIMSHEICQNIPVIMMSSHDSMGIVLKCLSKGAVDFLVKPVRKNELKNLWQHVWRRCHSSSGSGTGSQTQNLALPKSEAGSGSNADSNTESDNANSALNVGKGSDNESGTQSSWTKGAVEVESLQQQCKQETCEPPSSTFVEIIQPKKEKNQNDWTQLGQTVGEYRDEKSLDNIMVQALKTPFARRSATYVEQDEEENAVSDQACSKKEDAPLASCIEVGIQIDNEPTYSGFVGCGNPSLKAVDLIGTMAGEPKDRYEDPHGEIKEDVLDQGVNLSQTRDTTISDFKFMPMLELTLKRAPHSEDNNETEDKRGLRQSGVSTFLRHNTNGTHLSYPWVGSFPLNSHLLPTEHGGHSSISLGNLGTENTGSLCIAVPIKRMGSPKGSGVDAPLYHQLSQSINNQYMGSSVLGPSGQEIISTPVPIKDETALAPPVPPKRGMPMPTSSGVMPFDSISTACSFALHSMFYSHPGVPMRGSVTPHKSERGVCDNSVHHEQQMVCPQALYHSHHYNHHHHHYVHHHHHHHRASQHKQPPDQDEETVNNAMTAVRLGAASNTVGNTFDANYGQGGSSIGDGSNGKINGSASGSNNGGNGQNGQSSIAVTPGNIGGSGTGNGVSSGTGSAVDQNRCAQREAALIKFRQKRKERCFEKKVRYQSRKWLAEQRPRVRGQFVRQATYDSAATVEAD